MYSNGEIRVNKQLRHAEATWTVEEHAPPTGGGDWVVMSVKKARGEGQCIEHSVVQSGLYSSGPSSASSFTLSVVHKVKLSLSN